MATPQALGAPKRGTTYSSWSNWQYFIAQGCIRRVTKSTGKAELQICTCKLVRRKEGGFSFFFFFFVFLGPHPQHMEVPRLGVQSELQPLAFTTATAMRDPSRICHLHHSSRQHWILNPLSKARDRTHNLMVPHQICFRCSQICFRCTMMGTPCCYF